jgi:hypothetical protein
MLRRSTVIRQADRRLRHHFNLDGMINPREWLNFHPKEFLPHYYDRHRFVYEQEQWAHKHKLLCRQVFYDDILRLVRFPEPCTWIIDCRMDVEKMHKWVPGSNWVPRDEIEYALALEEHEFSEMYGFTKPKHSEDIILISHDGLASEQAGWEFRKQYFQHVYNFRGGTNELFEENYADYPSHLDPATGKLPAWKGPFPQQGIYVDEWSHRKVLTRTGPFDRQYELEDFALPDLELEKPRHSEEHGPRGHMPYGIR